ncbi:hypothetical protein SLEP1_g49579 [Rubroshorea leprosula]|uniref:Uncharacterized protein n=1 Tax=Rubroshorea leprosula TaxID=152421 RepID=A0AAV5M0B7_9ROSI|nr:hypothetical protein SLEP1_g49579 [Rubroshorea leprosula]
MTYVTNEVGGKKVLTWCAVIGISLTWYPQYCRFS